MSYTDNIDYVVNELRLLGLESVLEKVKNGDDEFFITNDGSGSDKSLAKVRGLLYNLFYCLEIKDKYQIKTRPNIIQVRMKSTGGFTVKKGVAGQQSGFGVTNQLDKTSLTATGNNEWDVMPDEISEHEGNKLIEILEGNEDAFINDGFDEFKQQKKSGIMPSSYNPDNIFPIPEDYITPAGLKSVDDVGNLD